MADPTHRRGQFLARKEKFESFLTERGAEVLACTNEWELCRFRCGSGTSIIYHKKNGQLTWVGQAGTAYTSFLGRGNWRAAPATSRTSKSSPTCKTLRERDGDACFYCHQPVAVEDESVEHLVAITHGGPDHIANMVLAHREPCNREAGHLSVMAKIRLREQRAVQGQLLKVESSGEIACVVPCKPTTAAIQPTPPWET